MSWNKRSVCFTTAVNKKSNSGLSWGRNTEWITQVKFDTSLGSNRAKNTEKTQASLWGRGKQKTACFVVGQ